MLEKKENLKPEVKEKPKAKVINREKKVDYENNNPGVNRDRLNGCFPWISDKEMITYYIQDLLKNKKVVITIELEDK